MLVRLCSFSSATICLQVQSVNSNVYNQLISNLSALAALCQPSSDADSQLGLPEPSSYAATCHLTHKLSAQLYYINSSAVCQPMYIISSSVLCQLQVESVSSSTVCLLSCNLSAQLTFKFQLNCQLTC